MPGLYWSYEKVCHAGCISRTDIGSSKKGAVYLVAPVKMVTAFGGGSSYG